MKKILSIIIAIVFLMTVFIGTAFAGSGKKYNEKSNAKADLHYDKKDDKKDDDEDDDDDEEDADSKLEDMQEDLMRDVANLKKKYRDKNITVFANGQEIITESPIIKNGRLLLPIKAITKGLKASYTYDDKTGVIVITKGDIKVTLQTGNNVAVVNNTKLNLEYRVEFQRKNGEIIPLGLLTNLLKGKVVYNKVYDNGKVKDGVVSINDNTTGSALEQFNYAGVWSYGSQEGAHGRDNHWSSTTGSSLQVKFIGTKIKLYGAKAPNHGIAHISINGATAAIADYYSDIRRDNTLIYESPNLDTNKEHVLTVIVTGLKNTSSSGITITADRVEVTRADTSNLALNKTVAASSILFDGTTSHAAIKAVDGTADTRWSSVFTDQEWISVDLGSLMDVAKVKLKWETAFGRSYVIQLSADGTNWSNAASVTNGDGGVDEIAFTSAKARYVRMLGVQRATAYGYSLYEFEVYSK